MNDVTRILSAIEQGDPGAAEELVPLVYEELRKLAAQRLAHEKPGQTFQATALVHEAYVRLVDVEKAQHWNSRGHFFGAAAEAMRRILVERARHKRSLKAGGDRHRHDLSDVDLATVEPDIDLLALNEALEKLENQDRRRADVVKLRFFAGLTIEQVAQAASVFRSQLPAATGPMPAAGSASKSKRPKVTAIPDRSPAKKNAARRRFQARFSHWIADDDAHAGSPPGNDMATLKLDEAAIFDIARQIEAPEARHQFIQVACGEDRDLRARVEALLRVNDEQGTFLDSPVASLQGAINATFSEGVGTLIGPYKLIEQIGEGGFGVVFMAEQQHPIRRRVALKVLKAGMDTRQVVARFQAERQALALMEHAGIARVLDGGEAPSGRPYFVMELVKGIPITRFCDEHQLAPRERLALFVDVCKAVQHAHQKGIIHRDLKPTNVLVAAYDGKPVPKVIDFGVAKALGQQLTERTLVTGFGSIVGTLEYMSPEQAEFNAMDVDTRADIYSLGVLLYELLTGTTPLSSERLKLAAMSEVLRLIREEEPPRPSTRLSDSRDSLASISAQRRLEPASLTKQVRGELDWIVMKALEKDRNRRYETANGLARDIDRYLNDQPVEASSPGTAYRLRKFVRRNRGPVLAASLLLVALAGGVVGTTIGLVRAEQARRAAGKRAEGERVAKELAEKRLAQTEKAIGILGSMFENLNPMAEEQEGRPLRAILGERLDQAAAELLGEAVGDRLVVAQLQDRLGQTYLGLGHASKAEALFDKAVRTRQDHLGADHPLTLGSKHNQALAFMATGNGDRAIDLFQQVRDAHGRRSLEPATATRSALSTN